MLCDKQIKVRDIVHSPLKRLRRADCEELTIEKLLLDKLTNKKSTSSI